MSVSGFGRPSVMSLVRSASRSRNGPRRRPPRRRPRPCRRSRPACPAGPRACRGAARVDPFHGRYRATHARPAAARLRPALARLRLRADPSADAAPVRAGDRPPAGGRRRARPRARAGVRRRAADVPHPRLPRRRQALLRAATSAWMEPEAGIGPAATTRRSTACTMPRPRSPAARSGRSRRSSAATSSTPSIPGGGLHHAMPARASGFCIYNDPALAIARARRDGLRVLYVDLDVHHGDGVEAIHAADPGVLTVSFHESGRYLFPGTGFADEIGEGDGGRDDRQRPAPARDGRGGLAGGGDVARPGARGGVPARPRRLPARRRQPRLGSARPSPEHRRPRWAPPPGSSTTSPTSTPAAAGSRPAAAATTCIASCRGAGRSSGWPRAHREAPGETPEAWRERWAAEAQRYGQAPLPRTFDDPPTPTGARDRARRSQRTVDERARGRRATASARRRAEPDPESRRPGPGARVFGWWSSEGQIGLGRCAELAASRPSACRPWRATASPSIGRR